jgi:hypothetical protein
LDASGKQGRYVRIQLLDKDYLSLAEVQVMGVDPGAPVPPESGSPHAVIEPSVLRAAKANANGYTKIYSTTTAFAAIKTDGSIKVWGGSSHGDISAPSTGVYTNMSHPTL